MILEEQVWKMINRERKRKKEIKERIKMEEWERHFREILGGVEWSVDK